MRVKAKQSVQGSFEKKGSEWHFWEVWSPAGIVVFHSSWGAERYRCAPHHTYVTESQFWYKKIRFLHGFKTHK